MIDQQGLEIEEKLLWKYEESRHATKPTKSVFFFRLIFFVFGSSNLFQIVRL